MTDIINLEERRELFVDHYLIDRMGGSARLKLHTPRGEGVAISYDSPWERTETGSTAFFTTVFQDGDTFRMYYRGDTNVCYAESSDGIDWIKPKLGLVESGGSSQNNIIVETCQNAFTPFIDSRPGVSSTQKYKANMEREGGQNGVNFYSSGDGISFSGFGADPAIPWSIPNHFDSQNVMFWSEVEAQYVMYARCMVMNDGELIDTDEYLSILRNDLQGLMARDSVEGVYIRSTARATSSNLENWSDFTPMSYSDTESITPSAQLYTNQTTPYFRANHIYIALPGRIFFGKLKEKSRHEPAHNTSLGDCSDGIMLTTRAGSYRYDFTFKESLLRPGVGGENWTTRNNYPASGIIQTGESEMSIFVQRHYGQPTGHLERMTLRLDGFASLHALHDEGELVTKPVRFSGNRLELNYSTSAAGGLRVEFLDVSGTPIDGFESADCDALTGDEISRCVSWRGSTDLSRIVSRAVRIRFVLSDGDVYSFRFTD